MNFENCVNDEMYNIYIFSKEQDNEFKAFKHCHFIASKANSFHFFIYHLVFNGIYICAELNFTPNKINKERYTSMWLFIYFLLNSYLLRVGVTKKQT